MWPSQTGAALYELEPAQSLPGAMFYLGWAIHMVQDAAVMNHFGREQGVLHDKEEATLHELVENRLITKNSVCPVPLRLTMRGDGHSCKPVLNGYLLHPDGNSEHIEGLP